MCACHGFEQEDVQRDVTANPKRLHARSQVRLAGYRGSRRSHTGPIIQPRGPGSGAAQHGVNRGGRTNSSLMNTGWQLCSARMATSWSLLTPGGT
jgi:hypothetical protein